MAAGIGRFGGGAFFSSMVGGVVMGAKRVTVPEWHESEIMSTRMPFLIFEKMAYSSLSVIGPLVWTS
jgi:hypothetical protein